MDPELEKNVRRMAKDFAGIINEDPEEVFKVWSGFLLSAPITWKHPPFAEPEELSPALKRVFKSMTMDGKLYK